MSASTNGLKGQIESIMGVRKIAYAMQNVAASKMKRAHQQMAASKEYSEQLLALLRRVASSESAVCNPYLRRVNGQPKRLAIVLLGSDRGLCGALNANLFRVVDQQIEQYAQQGVEVFWDAIGARALEFCQKRKLKLLAKLQQVGDRPMQSLLVQNVRVLLNYYRNYKLDGLLIAHNRFVNNLVRLPVIDKLLPLDISFSSSNVYDYLFEPNRDANLNYLAVKYLETLVYQAVVDNIACEQVARMMAMRSAADNSAGIIQELQQQFHKERQLAITNEISDIIGGAEGLVGD